MEAGSKTLCPSDEGAQGTTGFIGWGKGEARTTGEREREKA